VLREKKASYLMSACRNKKYLFKDAFAVIGKAETGSAYKER
jgi:hypothetical protein